MLKYTLVTKPKAIRLALELGASPSQVIAGVKCHKSQVLRELDAGIHVRSDNHTVQINQDILTGTRNRFVVIDSDDVTPNPTLCQKLMSAFAQLLATQTTVGYLHSLGASDEMVCSTLLLSRRKYRRALNRYPEVLSDVETGRLIHKLRWLENQLLHDDIAQVARTLALIGYCEHWVYEQSDSVRRVYGARLDSLTPVRSILFPT